MKKRILDKIQVERVKLRKVKNLIAKEMAFKESSEASAAGSVAAHASAKVGEAASTVHPSSVGVGLHDVVSDRPLNIAQTAPAAKTAAAAALKTASSLAAPAPSDTRFQAALKTA